MSNEPDAVEGFVSYEQNHDDPALKAPHEARAQQAQEKAYHERNLAVAAFVTAYRRATEHIDEHARFGHADPAEEYRHTADGRTWRLLWCDTDEGQMSWHLPADYVPEWVEERPHTWDGHDTETKNERLASLAGALAAVGGDGSPSAEPTGYVAES